MRTAPRPARISWRAVLAGTACLQGLLLATPSPAHEPPPLLHDRTGPEAIVRSYYNAVNRQEYARAWTYFGESKPGADYASFTAGYERTTEVALALGGVTTDGAAGSIKGTVPVAIRATTTNGATSIYAGCVTTRQLQPALHGPPLRSFEIVEARLSPARGPLDAAVPPECDAGP